MDILAGIPQLIVYGIISGSILALGGVGLSLTYSILGFANFAHGDLMALGAYIALGLLALFGGLGVLNNPIGPLSFGLGLVLAFLIALVLTAIAAILIDKMIYKPLRRSGPVIVMISSIGVAIALRNILLFFWGPQPWYYIEKIQISMKVPWLLGVRIKPDELFIIATAITLVILLHLFLTRTRMGKAMRATADNMELARVTGINTERVILWTWGIGALLAAAGGILAGIENKFITPELGWQMLLSIFAAVILGGIGSPYGAIVGGMVIGLSEEISTAFISTGYKPAVAFAIMIIMLLVKPTGLFGEKS